VKPPGRVLETALYVDDLDAAERFYGGTVGLQRVLRADGRHVFFRCGPGLLLLFLAAETRKPARHGPPVPVHGATGAGHVCFAASAEELDGWRAHLEAAGVPGRGRFQVAERGPVDLRARPGRELGGVRRTPALGLSRLRQTHRSFPVVLL
jgi:catechol 2,3-dioxygenase-like lactoylglutathione lyase family enzyme